MVKSSNNQKSTTFGINNKVLKGMHYVMLLIMLHITFVAPAQGIILAYKQGFSIQSGNFHIGQNDFNGRISREKQYENLPNNRYTTVVNEESQNSILATKEVKEEITIIESDLKEGNIGISKSVPMDNPSDNLFKFIIKDLPKNREKVILTYDLYGVEGQNGVARSINDRYSTGGHLVKLNESWTTQREEISLDWLTIGENKILFTTPKGSNFSYKIKNLRIAFIESSVSNKIVIPSNEIQIVKDNKIYIKGFVRESSDKKLRVDVEGTTIEYNDGEFEGFVELTQEIKNRKFVIVRVYENNNYLGQEIISLGENLIQSDALYTIENKKAYDKVFVGALKKSTVAIEGASITILDSALTMDREISISKLRTIDFAPLGSDLTNVTKNEIAYRFLPDGTNFEKPVPITISYDPKLVPFGYSAKDIKTYYFDTKTKSWQSVPVLSVDEKNHTITALTTHFTDYVNGIIKVPESPETNAYTPTSISGIKIANPGEKINLIQPPTANAEGDANLSYPIEIPSGRGGMQPNLSVNYNSSNSNGWMGLGWNISTPSIDIDTRWGTPTFDAANESEIYTFSGEQLLLRNGSSFYLANKSNPITRVTNALFYERVEGAFNKIQRMGSSPSTYSWTITDKSGTVFTYGTTDAVLTNNSGNIVRWMLKKVQDVNGNSMEYFYTTKSFTGSTVAGGKQIYLQRIEYTKHASLASAYSVVFNRATAVPSSSGTFTREDKSINARLGFKEITDDVLESIEVKYGATLVRKYKFVYKQGVFKKTLLDKIQQYDGAGLLFNEHNLEYYDDTNNGQNIFGNEESFTNLATDVGGFTNIVSTNLGASHVTSYGGTLGFTGGYASIANPPTLNPFSQAGTGGIFGGLSGSDSKGKITFLDIDGDGLPDKLMQLGSGLSYRKNLGNNTFSNPKSIIGIDEFSRSKSSTNSLGLRASFGFFAGIERSWTKSYTDSYIEDVNGDGLLDVVKDRKVYFNTLRPISGDIQPQFNDQSAASPNVIYQDLSSVPSLPTTTSPTVENYIYDVVKVWEAPYTGTVAITGTASLESATSVDGVRFAIERGLISSSSPIPSTGANNTLLAGYPINISGSTVHTINQTNITVQKGQRIFFRTNSISNEENDLLNINPTISYTSVVSTNAAAIANSLQLDANRLNYTTSSSTEGFVTSTIQRIVAPYSGAYSITWPSVTIANPIPTATNVNSINLSDEVEFIVTKYVKVTNGSTVTETPTVLQSSRVRVYNATSQVINPNALLSNIAISSAEVDNDNSDNITSEVSFSFTVKSLSNVDWQLLDRWTPSVVIPNSSAGVNDGKTVIATPYLTIYNDIRTTNTFITPPSLPTTGTAATVYQMQPIFPTAASIAAGATAFALPGAVPNFGTCSTCPSSGIRELYLSVKGSEKNLLFNNATVTGTTVTTTNLPTVLAKYKIGINNNGTINYIKRYNSTTTPVNEPLDANYSVNITTLNSTGINIVFSAHNNASLSSIIKNNRIYFEYYTEYSDIADKLLLPTTGGGARIRVATTTAWPTINDANQRVQSNVFVIKGNNDFGSKYRGWGQFAYKTEYSGTTVQPLKESELIPNTTYTAPTQTQIDNCYSNYPNDDAGFQQCIEALNPQKRIFVLIPEKNTIYNDNNWYGTQGEMFVSNTKLSPKRQRPVTTDPSLNPGTTPTGTGAWGIVKVTQSTSTTASASAGVGASTSFGNNKIFNDHRDINGDRYPDLIDGSSFRFTNNKGAYNSVLTPGYQQESNAVSANVSAGGALPKLNFVSSNANGDTSNQDATSGNSNTSFSASGTVTNDTSTESLMDINGDGLVDKVEQGGNVKLNLGTATLGFETATAWGYGSINTSSSASGSLGGGVSLFNNSLSVGLNTAYSNSSDSNSFSDINSDGLPDKIEGSTVRYNLGTSFAPAVSLTNFSGTRNGISLSGGIGATFTACMYFIAPPFIPIGPKFCACAEGNGGYGVNGEKLTFTDVNGDGFSDIVSSDNENELKVRYSKIGRTNMLKTVHRPLGATITMDYAVTNPIDGSKIGNTYKMPFSKWAMTSVVVNDGHTGDGEDNVTTKFEYLEGLQDRRERVFLGFGIVKTHIIDLNDNVYRTSVVEYATANIPNSDLYVGALDNRIRQYFYKKGILTKSYMLDGLGRKHNETIYTYKFYNPGIPTPTTTVADYNTTSTPIIPNATATFNAASFSDNSRVLPLLIATNTKAWEFDSETAGAASHMKQQFTTVDLYDKYGNVKQFQDKGPNLADIADDIRVNILYFYNANNVVNVPMEHRITNSGVVFRLSRNFVNTLGDVIQIRKYLTTSLTSEYALYDIEYDTFGNIQKIMHPKGALSDPNSSRMSYTYTYDTNTKSYITSVVDSYGYSSSTDYRYDFGVPTKTTDSNNKVIEYIYDTFGRPTEVKGPYQSTWTIKNEYFPDLAIPVALTAHFDDTGEIYTSTFIDGFQRVIQTKKELQNCECGTQNTSAYRLSVSGKVKYDEFGRANESYLNNEEQNCSGTLVDVLKQFTVFPDNPAQLTTTEYDYLDRPLSTTVYGLSAGDATTQMSYTFGPDRYGVIQFMKQITLPNGNISQSFTDSKGQTTSSNQIGAGETYWTSFQYNKLSELLNVRDANDAVTYYTYDNFGRKTSINHPDSGMSTFKYDLASRLKESTNANLLAAGQKVLYKYNINQLTNVIFPTHTVEYKYGPVGAPDNGVGRLIYQSDLTGEQYFKYGSLGEVTENKRIIIDPLGAPRYFTTQFEYDTWGRIRTLVYPDGEKVKHTYDNGGLITHIENTDGQVYLENICYDIFEKRRHVEYGNGTISNYFYEPQQALQQMQVSTPSGAMFMSNNYEYDLNSNVTQISNTASAITINQLGGIETKTFEYDDFNRLRHSEGTWQGDSEDHVFALDMEYNSLHNILSKVQSHQVAPSGSGSFVDTPNSMNNYYSYTGGNQPHAVSTIDVFDSVTGMQSEQINNTYDLNGNLKIFSQDNLDTGASVVREHYWDEQNRLQAIVEDGTAHHYIYDASGERVLKSAGSSSNLVINGTQATSLNTPGAYTMYPSGYVVVGQHDYTKHYYTGSQRIATRMGDLATVNNFEASLFKQSDSSTSDSAKQTASLGAKKVTLQKQLTNIFEKAKLGKPSFKSIEAAAPIDPAEAACEQEYNALIQYWINLQTAEAKRCIEELLYAYSVSQSYCDAIYTIKEKTKCYIELKKEPIWWYHPDHLGSSSYLTDYSGLPSHYYNYLPFGEEMVSQNTSSYDNKYRFSGKELDEETGLSYFGARYYNPKWSVWLGVDPEFAKAPNWTPYRYGFNNPIRYTDPDGRWEWDKGGNLKAQKGDNSYSLAKFLGTNQKNALTMLNRSGYTVNKKGVLNLKAGQQISKNNLWVGTKSSSGIVVNNTSEATDHYMNGNGQPADVGDQSTRELLSSTKFNEKHTKITTQKVQEKGNFSVDLTDDTFHIGRTNVDYKVSGNGKSSSVTYTLFSGDGFWDPDFVDEKIGSDWLGLDRYKPDGAGPNLERLGGTPYSYKTRTRTYFFKPVEEKK